MLFLLFFLVGQGDAQRYVRVHLTSSASTADTSQRLTETSSENSSPKIPELTRHAGLVGVPTELCGCLKYELDAQMLELDAHMFNCFQPYIYAIMATIAASRTCRGHDYCRLDGAAAFGAFPAIYPAQRCIFFHLCLCPARGAALVCP